MGEAVTGSGPSHSVLAVQLLQTRHAIRGGGIQAREPGDGELAWTTGAVPGPPSVLAASGLDLHPPVADSPQPGAPGK